MLPRRVKIEAVKQVVECVHSVSRVATRLGITTRSLYAWIKKYWPDSSTKRAVRCAGRDPPTAEGAEAGYRQRDILNGVLHKAVRLGYAFIRYNNRRWPVCLLCQVLDVHLMGYHAWLRLPH